VLVFCACDLILRNAQALAAFPAERAVLNKERQSGSYRLSAYFIAKSITEAPLFIVYPIMFTVMVYWMTGMQVHAYMALYKVFWNVVCIGVGFL
jgi:ATP-binding cassette, subfamily G (WHITE), member 2